MMRTHNSFTVPGSTAVAQCHGHWGGFYVGRGPAPAAEVNHDSDGRDFGGDDNESNDRHFS